MRTAYTFIAVCLFALSACELFYPTDPDMLAKIDAEIAWANAAPVTVTIAFPEAWGFSPQRGTGRCLDDARSVSPRVGYSFTVQFDPAAAYGDALWIAYKTSELPPGNEWYINTAAINNAIKDLKELGSDEISITQIDGGKSRIIVYGKDAVTLIPKSELQPRIIFSDPPRGSIVERTPNNQITITFATAVDPGTLIYKKDHIKISGGSAGSAMEPMESYFALPSYDEENHRLTINSKGTIPADLIIEVKLGNGIKSPGGEKGLKETVLSYRTVSDLKAINSWMALYNKENERIEVYWKMPAGILDVQYQMNNGSFHPLQWEKRSDEVISSFINAAKPNDRSVRDGIAPIGFNRYTIILSFNDEQTQINIWNVPGMEVRQNWNELPDIILTEISSEVELNELRNGVNSVNNFSQNKIFVLMRNIILENWMPIGTSTVGQQFLGKFYGNGFTVRMGQNVFGTAEITNGGIFGVTAEDAVIRDLTMIYENTNVESTIATAESHINVGGITGQALGNTKILNCIVIGSSDVAFLTLNAKSNSTVTGDYNDVNDAGINNHHLLSYPQIRLGGIAGFMGDTSSIENSRAALNVTLNNVSGNNINNVGGVVGRIEGEDPDNKNKRVNINEVTCTGTVRMDKGDNFGKNDCGGIAGYLTRANMTGCIFGGRIDIPSGFRPRGVFMVGGLVGSFGNRAFDSYDDHAGYILGCSVTGDIQVTYDGFNGFGLGGVIGIMSGSGGLNNRQMIIENTEYSAGKIYSEYSGPGTGSEWHMRAGGFVGMLRNNSKVINCHSRAESLTVVHSRQYNATTLVGGFVGEIMQTSIDGCSSTSNIIIPENHLARDNLYVGGFVGEMGYENQSVSFSNCFATGSVTVENSHSTSSVISIGGFAGHSRSGGSENFNTIYRCYATGDVTAVNFGSSNRNFGVGGLVGRAGSLHIKESYATGNVTASKSGGTTPISAGGLVGVLGKNFEDTTGRNDPNSLIEDSYALGNVTANNPTTNAAPIYAGGLVGNMEINADNHIIRSFAAGTVSARNASTTANTVAGGLVGRRDNNGRILNNVALGNSVTVLGGSSSRAVSRIYGNPTTPPSGTPPPINWNYAFNNMRLLESADYNAESPAASASITTGTKVATGKDGIDIAIVATMFSDFWINTLGFNLKDENTVVNVWNISTVGNLGYPKLAWE